MQAELANLNRAFWDLGLRFSWDEQTWASLRLRKRESRR